jgi:hypothetical protein
MRGPSPNVPFVPSGEKLLTDWPAMETRPARSSRHIRPLIHYFRIGA